MNKAKDFLVAFWPQFFVKSEEKYYLLGKPAEYGFMVAGFCQKFCGWNAQRRGE